MAVTQPQPAAQATAAPKTGPIELPQTIFISEKPGRPPAEPPAER